MMVPDSHLSLPEDPADYEQLTSMVTFTSSDSSGDTKCITFDLKTDMLLEGDETFNVVISNSTDFTTGAVLQAIVTIQDSNGMVMALRPIQGSSFLCFECS